MFVFACEYHIYWYFFPVCLLCVCVCACVCACVGDCGRIFIKQMHICVCAYDYCMCIYVCVMVAIAAFPQCNLEELAEVCMCVCVCVCVCVCACMYGACVHVCVCAYVCMYAGVGIWICMCGWYVCLRCEHMVIVACVRRMDYACVCCIVGILMCVYFWGKSVCFCM